MAKLVKSRKNNPDAEPRWPALIAIVATGVVYAALPASLAIGPRWLLVTIVAILEVPVFAAHYRGYLRVNRWLGFGVSGLLTLFLMWSLALLVLAIPQHKESPGDMLKSAVALWTANVLIFAVWYWRLDAGGPYQRESLPGHCEGAFLFPQMVIETRKKNWSPQFIDYLFVAFNHSTAFSPTDVPIMSRWAKCLVMIQAAISLVIVVILAARAVNVFPAQ